MLKTVDDWLLSYSDVLKEILEIGRKLASNGRMELDVHDALEKLDKVVDLANLVCFRPLLPVHFFKKIFPFFYFYYKIILI